MSEIPTPDVVEELYDLRISDRSSQGLFRSLEGAKAHASTMHRTYLSWQAERTPEEEDMYEEVYPELTWAVEQLYAPGSKKSPKLPLGEPVPVGRFAENSFFSIRMQNVYA